MRQKLLATTALAAVLASQIMTLKAAIAADMIVDTMPPPMPLAEPTPYEWCPSDGVFGGPYVGVHAGYIWGQSNVESDFSENGPVNLRGLMGGFHLGCNKQFSNGFVLGVEGDVSYSDFSGTHYLFSPIDTLDMRFRSDLQGSLRLRAGYAVENTLFYAAGGLAAARGEIKGDGFSDSNLHLGWTIGAGVEHAFTPNWLGRVEVRYSDFGSETYSTPLGDVRHDFDQTSVRVGISYKF